MGSKLRPADLLVGVSTVMLLIATLLPWFALPSAAELVQSAPGARLVGSGSDGAIELNVWDLGFARWWIYLSILFGACLVLAALLSRTPDWSTILGTPLVICSLIAAICLLVRLVSAPRPYASAEFGFYLALAGGLLLLAGAAWGLRDETVPEGFAKAPRPELIEVE